MSAAPTIFIGGSRNILRLHPLITARLTRIVEAGHPIVIGDAIGVDTAVQSHLAEASHRCVTIFTSGDCPRNYLGPWAIRRVPALFAVSGYDFHAAKDRAMADEADLGFMIWDGISLGTVLNALRLTRQGKPVIVAKAVDGATCRLGSVDAWTTFVARYPARLRSVLRARATATEWATVRLP